MNDKRKPLTAESIEVCANLRRIWSAKKKALGLSQQAAADALGVSQAAISHWLQGRNALHTDAIIAWAKLLECSELDIDPNRVYSSQVQNPQWQQEISELLNRAGPENRRAVMALLRSFVAQLDDTNDEEI